jgi:PAS domain S-box-containing protein
MWDISTPIIVAGKIIGAIYLGQFIYDDDKVDDEVFRNQAKLYGYDKEEYMKALDEVPRVSHQEIENIMNFYIKFANMVALLGYKNLSIQAAHAQQEELIKSLKESEKRFASTINNIPDAILVFDSDYNIQYANDAIYEISKKNSSQLIGAKAEEIWRKDDVQVFFPTLKEALETKKIQSLDLNMVNGDNIKRNYLATFVPITENGVNVQILGIFHDYTEKAKIEEAKRYQDVLIKEMGEIAKIGGWEFDPITGNGTWTDEVALIHDIDPKLETNMQTGMSFYAGESKIRMENAIKAAIDEAKPYDIELELTTAKGNKKWIRTIGQPTVEDGKVIRIHGSFQDISSQKQTEQKVIESETRYRNLLEAAPVGIAVHVEEKIVFVNPAGMAMLGATSADQIIGKSIFEIIHQRSIKETRKRVEKLESGEKGAYPAESVYVKLDGTPIPVEVMATILKYQGKPAVQIIVSDITDRIKAKEAIEKLNIELEQMVEARTKQLMDANKELDTFTYSVSHDLKAPLRGIDGYSKLLLEEYENRLDEEGQYFLNMIRQSVTRMNQLIEDLLSFSRLERKSWQSAEIDLNKMVKDQIKELADDFLAGGGTINADMPSIILKTQYEGVSMAIKNLIENAIKYSPNVKNAIVEICAEENQNNIIIQVKDNGLGFDMKYHDRIFNIFERLHRAEDYPGTGIGLAIVKRVADRLKGRVWADSKLGEGSIFYFEIPKEV